MTKIKHQIKNDRKATFYLPDLRYQIMYKISDLVLE